jgi:hypothetical protein
MPRKLIRHIYIGDPREPALVAWFSDSNRRLAEAAACGKRDNNMVIVDEFDVPVNDIQLSEFLNTHASVHPNTKTKVFR